jgi:sugar lactone lactonase YvrE
MKYWLAFISILIITAMLISCGEKITRPEEIPFGGDLSDTVYVQLNPAWDSDQGYDFSNPGKLIVGRDTYIYVCDTGNDRIVRLDAAGTVYQEYSVPHPTGITQDELLRLLVVNHTRNIYKIDVGPGGDGQPVICYSGSRAADDSLIFDDYQDFVFTDISALPGAGKVYLASGCDTLLDATGQVYAFWNSVPMAENTDTLIDGAVRETGNSTLDPVVDYGTGVGYADHPNSITSFIRNNNLYLLMTQDSSSFKTQLMSWYVNTYYQVEYFQPAILPGGENDLYADQYLGIRPNAACTDSSGNIYVVVSPDTVSGDSTFSAYKFGPMGELKERWGLFGANDGELNFPRGIAYDNFADRRTVYISDSGNNRILRFMLSTDIER